MTCPHCGGQVLASQRFCGNCGGAIPTVSGDVTVATLTPPPVDAATVAPGVPTTPPVSKTPPVPEDPAIAATMAPGLPEDAVTFNGHRTAGTTGPGTTRPGAAPTTLQPGMRFGRRYHLIRLLGEGGMGAVFQAWDEELAVVVAIKVIRPESLKDPAAARDLERRFKRELLLARNVTHKNVVRIHDLGEIDGVKYITMPYVHGGDLAKLISQEGRLAVPRALNIARQVVGGLVAAHEAGIVHRDLKPGNILLDEEDRALITDFGIARSVTGGGGTMAGTIVGTLEYMAPEQAQGAAVDHRADIYAFGLILSDMLIGRREGAHSATAMAELFARMSKAPPPVRTIDPTIPEAIDELIGRCVDPDPGKRYQTTHELAEDLDAVSGPRTTASRSRLTITAPPVEGVPAPPLAPSLPNPAAQPTATAVPYPVPQPVRWKHRQTVAIIALVLVVGAVGFLLRDRLISRPPPASVSAPARSASLFILPFRNASGDSSLDWLGPSAANMLRTEVGQSAALRTVSGDRVTQILTDMRIASDANLDPATLQRVARFGSADTVLWGQYVKFGNEIRIDATLQDLTSERTVALKEQAANDRDLPAAIERLAASVRENLALPPEAIKALAAASFKPSSKSVQALRYYNEGLDLTRQGKQLDAQKRFEASIQEDPDFALAHSNLAQTYTALAFAKEAEKFSRRAVELSDALPAAEKYLILATRARVLNDSPKAIEYYEKLDKILPGNDDVQYALATLYEDTGAYDKASKRFGDLLQRDPKYIDALLGAARVQIRSDKGSEALDYLNRAQTIAIQRGNDEARATTLWLLGICYRVLNKPDDAVRYYRDSLAVNRKIGRQRGIADSLHSLAEVENAQGHSDAALKDYREALQLRRQIGDAQGIGNLLIDMGNVYADLGNSNEALTLFKEALQTQREVGNTGYEALALNNIGDIYMTRGEHEEARTYFERALSLREKLNVPLDVADSLHNVGETYLKTGAHDAALAKYLKALELRRQNNDRRGTAIELHSVGTIFEYQGRYGAAIDSKQEAVKTFRETGERGLWLARLLCSYGSALASGGRGEEATPLIDEAFKYATELKNDELMAQVVTAQGERSFYKGEWAGARTSFQRAVQLASRAKSPAAALLAELDTAKVDIIEGRAPAASQVLKRISTEADRIGLKYVAVESDLYLGRAALTLRQHAPARDTLERALTEAERLGARVLVAKAHFWLASTLQAMGKDADARRHSDETRRIVDEIRREARSDKILDRADLRDLAQR